MKKNGATPLIVATCSGYSNIVQMLLMAGADIDAQDNVCAICLSSSRIICRSTAKQHCIGRAGSNMLILWACCLLSAQMWILSTRWDCIISHFLLMWLQNQRSPLQAAACRSSDSIASMLINAGAVIDDVDEVRWISALLHLMPNRTTSRHYCVQLTSIKTKSSKY